MRIKEILDSLENLAPLTYAEGFDNVGLLTGSKDWEVTGVLTTLDTLEAVVDEAIEKKCNLIISFHPIIFSGIKKFSDPSYVERTVIKALKNDIAIYAIHTALDNQFLGVNHMIGEQLQLKNQRVLLPQPHSIRKLTTYVPTQEAEAVRNALFEAGAGGIGNYDHCSFNLEGTGSFRGNEDSNPVKGEKGILHFENEIQIGVTFPKHLQGKILAALFSTHSYEEVAYEIYTLENQNQHLGMGMIGELETELDEGRFLEKLKETFKCGCIRHSAFLEKKIRKVAVLGGSGSFAIESAKKAGADTFLTADLKYHDFFKAEGEILLADIGHYESEQFTKNLLHTYLTKKFANFAIVLSDTNTNPIKYF